MAIHIGVGNFAGAIASGVYRSKDAPHYTLGRKYYHHSNNHRIFLVVFLFINPHLLFNAADSVVIGFICMGIIVTPVTAWVYSRINARRDAQALNGEDALGSYSIDELAGLGDRAPDFRYSL